ncbi:MAG: serine/threonine protein kinase [Myxococcota bacterium]|nr:serine/threonine protein kinase [Myxococcota bacterium]
MTFASNRIDVGVQIGPYLVERRLGQTVASTVYVVRDQGGGRVVLRVVKADVVTSILRTRLKREVRALASVKHPGIVHVHGVGEHAGLPWVATSYVHGTDLARVLDERGPLPLDVALRHAVQAAEALVVAHGAGVVHRDLMPRNLLLTSEGRIVLVDFGFSPRSPNDESSTGVRNPLAGASAYAAPEQLEHGLADERSDVWALGCVLYEMVVGVAPFGKGGSATVSAILRDEPPFPSHVAAGVVHIVNACVRKNSFARIATARELLAMLRDALDDSRVVPAIETERASVRPSVQPGFPSGVIPPPPRLPSMSLPSGSPRSNSAAPTSRPPSSDTRVAVARGRIKGTAVRAGIAWFASIHGDPGLTRVVDLASPELRAILSPKDPVFGLIASGWYETQLVGELVELIERVAAPTDPMAFGASVGDAIARDNVNGVHRALFRLVTSPVLLEANAQRVWRTYVDEGTLSVRIRTPSSFDARVRGWSHHHPSVCRTLRAMLESALREVGYAALVLARKQCVAVGDPQCVFGGTWAG